MIIQKPTGLPNLGLPLGSALFKTDDFKTINAYLSNVKLEGNPDRYSFSFNADVSGCGHWRMMWPENALVALGKGMVFRPGKLLRDPNYYAGAKSIRMQRQCSHEQLDNMKALRKTCDAQNIRLLYEIDDIAINEDIPDYNAAKKAFPKAIGENILEMMNMCDVVTTPTEYMSEYYSEKLGGKRVTTIPNYPPKYWIDRFYDYKKLAENFDKHKKRPKIAYFGSSTHFDISRQNFGRDDFSHVLSVVRRTVDMFEWVFFGGIPTSLSDLRDSGKITFYPWKRIWEYPQQFSEILPNVTIAPLMDNKYNRAKSDIKCLESAFFGVPCVAQNLTTFKDWGNLFNTGDEMVDILKTVMQDRAAYLKNSKDLYQKATTRLLENPENISKYETLYFS
jgi:hypothetical protein